VLALLSLALLLPASTRAMGDEATVLRVLVVETADVDAYLKEIERGRAIAKRLGSSSELRVWRARFAGPQAGAVVVSIEYPSLAALAEDEARLRADTEWRTWFAGLDKIRKIVSDSLYNELGP
ncbi:MAG: hypothetical protein L0191_01920, partial [Acidobacteria bacterium]|nr:hypothetical protein [Acidobacteriota bacterium]